MKVKQWMCTGKTSKALFLTAEVHRGKELGVSRSFSLPFSRQVESENQDMDWEGLVGKGRLSFGRGLRWLQTSKWNYHLHSCVCGARVWERFVLLLDGLDEIIRGSKGKTRSVRNTSVWEYLQWHKQGKEISRRVMETKETALETKRDPITTVKAQLRRASPWC